MKGNCNPAWEEVGTATVNQRSQASRDSIREAFLLQNVVEDDTIHFGLWDEDALTQDEL